MFPRAAKASFSKGFTLIEVMIVTAIIAILAAIAIPSYRDYVIRGSLPDATANLSGLRTRIEQYYLDNRTYANGTGCGGVTMPTSTLFTYTCTLVSATAYTLTATGITNKPSAGFTFTLDQTGTQVTTALPTTWAALTTVPVNRWVTRKGG